MSQYQVEPLFWGIKQGRGWGGCSLGQGGREGLFKRMILDLRPAVVCFVVLGIKTRASSMLGKHCTLSHCPAPLLFSQNLQVTIFGVMEFHEVSLHRFWWIYLKDLLGVRTLVSVSSHIVVFFFFLLIVSFPVARTGGKTKLLVSCSALEWDGASSCSLAGFWAGPLRLSAQCYVSSSWAQTNPSAVTLRGLTI